MRTMQCLIIDDEPLAHNVILKYMEEIPFLENSGQCYRATEALEFLSRRKVDLIFLDIRMPKLNGLDFLRALQQRPLVIVTSAFEEHALESFELDVCDYLLKPFRFDRFLKAVNRALSEFVLRNPEHAEAPDTGATLPYVPENIREVSIRSDKKLILVQLDEIQYLEGLGNYVKVWRQEGFLLTPRTLSSFEEQLPGDSFLRIHKSYLLHKKFVHYIEGNIVHLKNGTQLPLGKNYRQVIRELFNDR